MPAPQLTQNAATNVPVPTLPPSNMATVARPASSAATRPSVTSTAHVAAAAADVSALRTAQMPCSTRGGQRRA